LKNVLKHSIYSGEVLNLLTNNCEIMRYNPLGHALRHLLFSKYTFVYNAMYIRKKFHGPIKKMRKAYMPLYIYIYIYIYVYSISQDGPH